MIMKIYYYVEMKMRQKENTTETFFTDKIICSDVPLLIEVQNNQIIHHSGHKGKNKWCH